MLYQNKIWAFGSGNGLQAYKTPDVGSSWSAAGCAGGRPLRLVLQGKDLKLGFAMS